MYIVAQYELNSQAVTPCPAVKARIQATNWRVMWDAPLTAIVLRAHCSAVVAHCLPYFAPKIKIWQIYWRVGLKS